MIHQRLRRSGNDYVITIPNEVVEHNGWQEGQLLAIELTPLQARPILHPNLRAAIDDRWPHNEAALRSLADR